MRKLILIALLLPVTMFAQRWSEERAKEWYQSHGWLVGTNYSPAYAINQLEFWQPETFDTVAISRELKWSDHIGFNMLRVYLHDLLWLHDSTGFLKRLDQFLAIAHRHKQKVMFVFFDSVWDPFPHPGKQREPFPHVHNSGWVQSPGHLILERLNEYPYLERYVKGVINAFKNDKRVIAWELVNEPDNNNTDAYGKKEPPNKGKLGTELLKKSFTWAREANPTQPLTSAPWYGDWSHDTTLNEMNRFCFDNSDFISFHCYNDAADFEKRVKWLARYNRPIVCTEYMARPTGSTIQHILPIAYKYNVDAINWGFVDGKTQTKYPWDTWTKKYTAEPPVWFHEILRSNGDPYDQKEVDLIRTLTTKKR